MDTLSWENQQINEMTTTFQTNRNRLEIPKCGENLSIFAEVYRNVWPKFEPFFISPDERLTGLNVFCKRKAFLWFYHVCMLIGRIEYTMKPNQFNGRWYLKWNDKIKIENLLEIEGKQQKNNNNKNQTTLLHTYTLAHKIIGLDGKLWYLFHSIGQRRMLLIKFAIVSIDKNVLFNRFMYKC